MTRSGSAARQQFVDDELFRLPMLGDHVFDATWRAVQEALPSLTLHERAVAGELLQVGPPARRRMVERFVASVRDQVAAELAGAAPVAAAPAPAAPRLSLSLLDEAEIAADVEISRAIETIKSVADHELREMATYASALAGDPDVSRDHNPFRAETYARAMWDAVQALPLAKGYQAQLMRHAAQPLAEVLRKVYAGACARLEAQGVEPAAYRTLILPGGPRTARPSDSWQGGGTVTMQELRATIPAPLVDEPPTTALPLEHVIAESEQALRALPPDAPVTVRAQLIESQRARLVQHARSPVDQHLIELLTRLFEAMLSDPRIARDIRSVLARLQPSALRLVLRDESALDDYTHPVWRFMDLTAHLAALHPEGSRGRDEVLQLAEQLIDAMARETVPDAQLYRSGLDRLAADDRARFEARVRRARADIEAMQDTEDRLVAAAPLPVPTGHAPLDEGQLETVPADLLDSLPSPSDARPESGEWVRQRRPGEWLRMFVHGQWQRVQLLAIGRHGEAWLFGVAQGDDTVALRRRALERLHAEGLLNPLRVRSMLRSAAVQVLRRAGRPV